MVPVVSCEARLNRLLSPDGLARVLLADCPAPEDVARWLDADLAAVCVGLREAVWLQAQRGRGRPGLLLRLDPVNLAGQAAPLVVDVAVEAPPRLAVRLDSVGVVLGLPVVPVRPDVLERAARRLARVAAGCAAFGMPLFARVVVLRPVGAREYAPQGDAALLAAGVRLAVDLGADGVFVEAAPAPAWRDLVRAGGGRPVFVDAGGGRPEEAQAAGAAGLLLRQAAQTALRSPRASG